MKYLYIFTICCLFGVNLSIAQNNDVYITVTEPARLFSIGDYLYYTYGIDGDYHGIARIDTSIDPPVVEDLVNNVYSPTSMVLKGDYLYFAQYFENKLSKIDITSDSPTAINVVTSGLSRANGLALNGNDLYISTSLPGSIKKIDISSDNPTVTTLVTGLQFPTVMAIDNNVLYVSETSGDQISKFDISPNSLTLIDVISGLNNPLGLRINGNYLYVCEKNGGALKKIDISSDIPSSNYIAWFLENPTDVSIIGNDIYVCGKTSYEIGDGIIYKIENGILGSNELNPLNVFLFPNPTTDFLYISNIKEPLFYDIFNLEGKKIISGSLLQDDRIDVTSLKSGTYLIQLNKGWTKKIIIK